MIQTHVIGCLVPSDNSWIFLILSSAAERGQLASGMTRRLVHSSANLPFLEAKCSELLVLPVTGPTYVTAAVALCLTERVVQLQDQLNDFG